MQVAQLEHLNMTVKDPAATANMMTRLFGWTIRWHGASLGGGTTYHVGTKDRYIALYSPKADLDANDGDPYHREGGLNHVGLLVDDLDAYEQKILEAGYKTHSHQEYEPGRRFYFHDENGVEYEILSYGETSS